MELGGGEGGGEDRWSWVRHKSKARNQPYLIQLPFLTSPLTTSKDLKFKSRLISIFNIHTTNIALPNLWSLHKQYSS